MTRALTWKTLIRLTLHAARQAGADPDEVHIVLGMSGAELTALADSDEVPPPDVLARFTAEFQRWHAVSTAPGAAAAATAASRAPITAAPAPASTTAASGTPPKPKAPVIDFNAIPPDLQAGRFFVMWRFVLKKDKQGKLKWTKPPYQTNGMYASTTNPATWCTMAEAKAALVARNPDGTPAFDGIGRVFSPDDPLQTFGFDLDECIAPDANGVKRLSAEAKQAIKELDCYAELSPSGDGVHVIGLGHLPGAHFTNNTLGREAYDNSKAGRYLTMTGQVLPGFESLRAPDPAIVAKWHSQWKTHSPGNTSTATAAPSAAPPSAGAGSTFAATPASTSTSGAYVDVDLAARGIRARVRALIESLDGLGSHYGGDRSKALLGAAIELVKAGLTDDEIVSVLTDPKHAIHTVAQSTGRRNTRDSAAQWIRAYTLPNAHQKAAAQAALRQASVNIGATGSANPQVHRARSFTMSEMMADAVYLAGTGQVALRDELRTHYESLELFNKATAASKHQITKKGQAAEVPVAKLWFDSADKLQRQVLTYAPGEGEMVFDPNGVPAFNLWLARPHITPIDWHQRVPPFLEHVEFLISEPDMRELFLDWLAHIEQDPGTLPHAHFAHIARAHGLGRNWLGSVLARVFAGATALGFDLGGYLRNGFNGALARKELVIVDELNESRRAGARSDQEDVLRRTLTESFTTINPKYGKQRQEKNVKRWLVWSNRQDALPMTTGDRRWNVIQHDGDPRSASYYARLYALLDDPLFIASVREFLRQRDISGFNPGAHAVLNQAKLDMIDAGRTDDERNADLLVARWPSEMVRSAVALRVVQPGSGGFAAAGVNISGGKPFMQAMRAAGAVKGDRTNLADAAKAQTWILGDHERWKKATATERQQEIERGEAAIGSKALSSTGDELLALLDSLPDRSPIS